MRPNRAGFWRDAVTIRGSITPIVLPCVLAFGLFATGLCALSWLIERVFHVRTGLEVAPYEIAGAGAALGLLLILRTNAGYDRWWEARKLWGGIVNQSRNLGISALSYGPSDQQWRTSFIHWSAAFSHVARCSLRGEPPCGEVVSLLGREEADRLAQAPHMPSAVALRLGEMLLDACERHGMDRWAFMQVDKERAMLIDHIGACERILKTPLPRVYAIKIRRFLSLFLLTLPLALLHRVSAIWLIPIITMLVAYPLVALDQIGVELQNPFAKGNLSHLPLDDICRTIEANLTGMLKSPPPPTAATAEPTDRALAGRAVR
jgi:putative membrane protein